MANFVDENELQESSQEEISQVTEQTQESQVQETPTPEPEVIPEKYKNKSVEDIVKMHQEAEKMIGRQAQEVHEVRSLADQLLKQQLDTNKTKETTEQTQEEDFFSDPQKAVNRTVDQHPAVLQAQRFASEMKQMQNSQKLEAQYPNYRGVATSEPFLNWVKASPVRIALYTKAETELDYDSANELLGTYQELNNAKATQQSTQMRAVETKAQNTALKAAGVDVGGSGEVSRKVYRRADLIKLKMTDPDRYMALQDEIMSAYADGRVK
jgi:hypothetical protein